MARVYRKKSPYEKENERNKILFLITGAIAVCCAIAWGWNIFSNGHFLAHDSLFYVFFGFAGSSALARHFYNRWNMGYSGSLGAERGVETLGLLDDEYHVLTNVRVEGRTIGDVVVGPTGVFVVLTKNHNGEIVAGPGKTWEQHKTGRKGTAYTVSMRNPVQQLKSRIYAIKNFLKEDYGINVWIDGIVFFTNPSCHLCRAGDCGNYTDSGGEVLAFITDYPARHILSHSEIKKITAILE